MYRPATNDAAYLADLESNYQDVKIPLVEQARKLDQIVFHEKLGTIADKVERVAKLAQWLVNERLVKGADPLETLYRDFLAAHDRVYGHSTEGAARIVNIRSIHRSRVGRPEGNGRAR